MNPTRRRIIAAGAGVLATPALFDTSSAQGAFPSKPIRIVVPYPAGGQTDGIARSFGDFLSRKLGQSVVVENKPGGAGIIGTTGCPSGEVNRWLQAGRFDKAREAAADMRDKRSRSKR